MVVLSKTILMVNQLYQRMIHGRSKMVNLVRSMKPKVQMYQKIHQVAKINNIST